MNWNEIVKLTATAVDRPQRETDKVLQAFLRIAGDSLVEDPTRRIVLRGIGTLSATWTEPRVVRSPRDRRRIYVDGRWRLRFRVSEALRKRVEARSPQLWRAPEHQAAWRLAETLVADLALYHPDQCPTLRGAISDAEVHEQAASALGNHWQRAVRAYETDVPEGVRQACDHLASAARRRWGGRTAVASAGTAPTAQA